MSFFNPFAIAFAFVAGGFVVGVDYVVQSKAAGSNPGEYAFSAYLDSYGIRVDDTFAMIDKTKRQSVEARVHLPMEPKGWERTEWDIGAIDMDEITAGMAVINKMTAKKEWRKAIALANYEAWEYTKGDYTIRISASYKEDREPSETAIAGQLSGNFHPLEEKRYRPYRAFSNVPFLAVEDTLYPDAVTKTLLEARLGDEILIAVASNAKDEDLHALLAQIDFHNLNLMLDDPLPYVGENAEPLTQEQMVTLAGLEARALNAGKSVPPEMVVAILSGATIEQAAAQVKAKPTVSAQVEDTRNKPKKIQPSAGRIQLSGGRTCLSEGSRLCN